MNDPLRLVGRLLGEKYLVQAFVSEGGFAVVYRAEHVIWRKPVALKLFSGLSSAPEAMRETLHQAFLQEGAFLSELCTESVSIVQPRDVGTYTSEGGQWIPYMVLEWLEGLNLEQLVTVERSNGAPPWALQETVSLLAQVAVALDIAHAKGIAHRDVKPANLLLVGAHKRTEIGIVKVLDFGVAKMMAEVNSSAALASTGAHVTSFTPQYAAPEQFDRSLGATGPWTDVYSLALVVVELLAGRSLSEGDDVTRLGAVTMDPARRPTPRTFGVAVSDEVEAVFACALDVRTERRYERAGQFWIELEAASGLPLSRIVRDRTLRANITPITERSVAPISVPASFAPASFVPDSFAPSVAPRAASRSFTPPHGPASVAPLNAPSLVAAVASPTLQPRPLRRGRLTLALGSAAVAASVLLVVAHFGKTDKHAPKPPRVPAARLVTPDPVAPVPECPADTAKIPAGQFFMGSELKDAPENEKPSHNVTLDAFCMDLHEVTAGQYKACADVGKCKRPPKEVDWPKISDADRKLYSPLCTFDDPDKQNHPINCVTWEMADIYCAAAGRRLPTEAEWEFATRGPDGRVYPWGDEPPTAQHLNACGSECSAWGKKHDAPLAALYPEDDGYVATAPVGSFPKGRSRFGPFDVVGNVWEWTSTWYGPYSGEKISNPQGPDHGERRVIRGGAFNGSFASWLHPSFRYGQVPVVQSHGIGFRCAQGLATAAH